MTRWAMVIDLDRCTACQACVVACQVENNVPPPTRDDAERGRALSWIRLVPFSEGEHGTRPGLRLVPLLCMHCEHPPCIKVCPVKATRQDHEGLVGQAYARCIGCRYCTTACPYTVRQFNWDKPQWPKPMETGLSPDVSVRPRGVVEKCSFCHHRLQRAKDQARADERPLRDGDYVPACVESCPAEAMFFGDLDDPRSIVARLTDSPRAFRLLEELGTAPKVIYLSKGERSGEV
jgi:Fe-S-cluster-containing dehydrogenase component